MRHARAMTPRSATEVPADLRARLETARLDLLALFRALDRMDLGPSEIPQRLIRQLFELDADFAEAGGTVGLGSTSGKPGCPSHGPRHTGGSGTVARGLGAISKEASTASSSCPGATGSHRSPESATCRSLQHGPRPRSRNPLSTPMNAATRQSTLISIFGCEALSVASNQGTRPFAFEHGDLLSGGEDFEGGIVSTAEEHSDGGQD